MRRVSFVLAVGMILLWIVISLGAIILMSTTQASLSESSSSSQDSFDEKFELIEEKLIKSFKKEILVTTFNSSSSEEKQERNLKKEHVSEKIKTVEINGQIKIGRCRLTIYTPYESSWGYSTATGIKSEHLQTCAVDPNIIPYGSTVILKAGDTELRLKAVDCGNFRGRMIDVFYDGSVSDGVNYLISTFGSEYAEVWIER